MNLYSLKRHGAYRTKTVKTAIIGGETDYCAERFGYKKEKKGISATKYYEQVTPLTQYPNVIFAEHLPAFNYCVFSASNGDMAAWYSENSPALRKMVIITNSYPVLFSDIVNTTNMYIAVSGSCMAKISPAGIAVRVNNQVRLIHAVFHCGRVFASDYYDRFMVRWSGDSFSDWKELPGRAGNLRLYNGLGKVLNLFEIGEKIAVVREYGVTVISVLGDCRHIRVEPGDCYRLPKVYENGSAICRGQIYIYTMDGMYVFNGSSVFKAPFEDIFLPYVLEKPKVVGERFLYYMARLGEEKCLFEYDVETGSGAPFAKGAQCPFFIDGKGYCFNGSVLCRLTQNEDEPDRVWVSRPFDFNTSAPKTLKSVTVAGDGGVVLEIDCDGRKLVAEGTGKTVFCARGEKFVFKVKGNCVITELTAEWEVGE